MSLIAQPIDPIPEQTATVAHQAFPQGTTVMHFRDELDSPYKDEDFKDLFGLQGQPGWSPWRLAMITVMQYMEDLSDRQAADAVRGRLDWKYALSLELEDPGIDASVLSEFRQRLVNAGAEQQLLNNPTNLLNLLPSALTEGNPLGLPPALPEGRSSSIKS